MRALLRIVGRPVLRALHHTDNGVHAGVRFVQASEARPDGASSAIQAAAYLSMFRDRRSRGLAGTVEDMPLPGGRGRIDRPYAECFGIGKEHN